MNTMNCINELCSPNSVKIISLDEFGKLFPETNLKIYSRFVDEFDDCLVLIFNNKFSFNTSNNDISSTSHNMFYPIHYGTLKKELQQLVKDKESIDRLIDKSELEKNIKLRYASFSNAINKKDNKYYKNFADFLVDDSNPFEIKVDWDKLNSNIF